MYLEHYGLREPPFSITPDPRFVFLSERHRDALAHLLFGIGQGGGGGFVQLTGEVGTGKTTLCRLLLEQLPENTRAALVLNPRLNPVELLETICEELHLDLANNRGSVKALVDLLNAYLLDAYAHGLHVVLIIDEAQNLSFDALEQVRLLTNLETPTQKLLQIILLGQPELRTMLAHEALRQLAQRITARYHLTPLNAGETEQYLRHRYAVAGGQHFPFSSSAVRRIHAHSKGVPRLINVIAERTLLAGYAHDQTSLASRSVNRAARETLAPAHRRWLRPRWAMGIAALVTLAVAAMWLRPQTTAVAKTAIAKTTTPPRAVRVKSLAPVAAPIPLLDYDALAQRVRDSDPSPLMGWNQLLAMWKVPAARTDTPATGFCTAVIAPGVYCLSGQSPLDKLAVLGRPALLRLHIDGHETSALLLGADAVAVRLQLGDTVFDIDRRALQRLWNGDFIALWHAPDSLAEPVSEGLRGPAVDWIQQRLHPQDVASVPGTATLDATMLESVRRFQDARGLLTDGVIGPETLMALAIDEDGPRLRRVLE